MPVDLEPFRLAAAAVEREHQLGAKVFAVRVLGHQRLELGDECEVAAERQLRVDALLDGRQPELLEPLRLDLREPLELEIPERPSVPEGFRGAEGLRRGSGIAGRERLPPLRGEPLEALEVELSRLDPQQVAAPAGGETRLVTGCRAEDPAEPRDVVSQRVIGGVDALILEQLADQPLARDDAVRTEQEQGEERALLRASRGDGDAVHTHRERAQDPELQPTCCHRAR